MIANQAKAVARQWVSEYASHAPGFCGAFFHGSINWLPDDAVMPPYSDIDVMVVLAHPNPPDKLGKFVYQDVMLEVSYVSRDHIQSPDINLGQPHIAGSFRRSSVILDPSGQLTKLQAVVSKHYAKRRWVTKRCENAMDKVLQNLQGLKASEPFHDQVVSWLFATGVTTHVLLVAGLKNPTVRQRYVAVRALLAEYGRLEFYNTLLEMLGCARMGRERVESNLAALIDVFDVAKDVVSTPFPFAADISDIARPIAIEGSRDLIERGYHREAIFWIVATYSRCQKVLYYDAPMAIQDRFTPGYRQLLGDLGITSFADLRQRGEQIKVFLPRIWDMAEEIMATNLEIED
jgi:hypothetical protein